MRAPPPPGPPWDAPLEEATFAFVDLEMTGLGPADRIIEICVVRERGGVGETAIDTLVRPDDARFGNAHIHGITADELATAPTFAELADRVESALAGAVFVGHGIRHDVQFLAAEMARVGRAYEVAFPIDTLTLSRRSFALPNHSLDALASEFQIPRGRAHRAADDVEVLRAVFRRAVAALTPSTVRDLFETRIGVREARPAIVDRARELVGSGEIVRVRYRPSGRAPELVEMVLTAVIPSLKEGETPRVVGYLVPSRGRRELRADRILAIDVVGSGAPNVE